MAKDPRSPNLLLAALPRADYELLGSHLQAVELINEAVPFNVHCSQAFILGSLFGWKNKHGVRRFRRAYIEEGKGSGKSPMLAGVGHYMMMARNKLRAEVYAAATDKDQAAILFRDAVEMWRRSPSLQRWLIPSGVNPVWQLTAPATSSFFKPISSEKMALDIIPSKAQETT